MASEIQSVDMADGSTVVIEVDMDRGKVLRIVKGNGSATFEDMQAIVDRWEKRGTGG